MEMTSALSRRFDALKAALKSKQLDPQAFAAAVGQLRTTDSSRRVWALLPTPAHGFGGMVTPGIQAKPQASPRMELQRLSRLSSLSLRRIQLLVQQLQANQVSREAFDDAVLKLKIADDTGVWWMISAETGGWLKWAGNQWTPAVPPREHVSSAGPVRKICRVSGSKRKGKDQGNSQVDSRLDLPVHRVSRDHDGR